MSAWGLEDLAEHGLGPGGYAEAVQIIGDAERLVAAAKDQLRPAATTPAKAKMTRRVKPPSPSEAKG